MPDPILTRGAARELVRYLETPGWCANPSGAAYRAGALSERLHLALPDDAPRPANLQGITAAEVRAMRLWLAEPLGETLDKREVAIVAACLQHHQAKQQLTPNIHLTRLMDCAGLAPTD